MKKISIFLIVIILLSFCISSNAGFNITEEYLEKEIKEYERDLNAKSEGISEDFSINKNEDYIRMTNKESEYIIKYNLDEKPTFTIDLTLYKNMSKDELDGELEKAIMNATTFVVIAKGQGVEYGDSTIYLLKELQSKFITDDAEMSEDDRNNYIEGICNGEYDIENEAFSLKFKKENESDGKYNLKSVLEINTDADLISLIRKAIDELTDDILSSVTIQGNNKDTILDKNNTGKVVDNNKIENTNTVNNEVANIAKIPKTGKSFRVDDALKAIVILSAVGICSLTIYNRKKN